MNPLASIALWILGKVIQHLIEKYSKLTPEQKEKLHAEIDRIQIPAPTSSTGTEP